MVGAIDELDGNVEDGVTGDDAALQGLFDTLLDGRDVFLGNRTADDLVLEGEARTRLAGRMLMMASPYWPRPPDWRTNLP